MVGKLFAFAMIVLFIAIGTGECASKQTVRIHDLKPGQQCVVKARIGQRVAAAESDGVYVFTLRDDFGDTILARTTHDVSDIAFGATYYLTGQQVSNLATGNRPMLEVSSWRPVYPSTVGEAGSSTTPGPSAPRFHFPSLPPFFIPLLILIFVLVCIVALVYGGDRKVNSVEPWGFAEVQSGPDLGLIVALREDRIPVGRRQDPGKSVSIVKDVYVSRNQGFLIRAQDQVYFEDGGSTGGSWVDERKVESGQTALVAPRSLIRIGPKTVIRVRLAGEQDETLQTRVFSESDESFEGLEAVTHHARNTDEE